MESTIISIIKQLLDAAHIPYRDVAVSSVADQLVFRIETDGDARELVGQRGEIIRGIDHLVKRMAEQQGVEELQFFVDANDYRVRQVEEIQTKARMMAERARSFEYDVELTPMSAYERLIVHTTLADVPGIVTESHGEGRSRRVVIRYERTQTGLQPEEGAESRIQ